MIKVNAVAADESSEMAVAVTARASRGGAPCTWVNRWLAHCLILPSARGDQHDLTPRFGLLINIVALCGLAVLFVLDTARLGISPARLTCFMACLAVTFVLQAVHSTLDFLRWRPRRLALTLSVQAVFSFLPFFWMGPNWPGIAGFLCGSLLLVVRSPRRWSLFFLAVAADAGFAARSGASADRLCYSVILAILMAVVVYGLGRLSALIWELCETRSKMARMAVAQERRRFGRDLHDLLGYSLAAIVVKGELVDSLLLQDPQRAHEEIAGILQIARDAVADVRRLPCGSREMSLATELSTMRSVCAAAGVDVLVEDASVPVLPQAVETVLATVLREGVANMLRHSSARHCRIEVTGQAGRARLSIANDGAPGDLDDPSALVASGSGLRNLAARLDRIGGSLSVEHVRGGHFRLVAEAPLTGGARLDEPPLMARTLLG